MKEVLGYTGAVLELFSFFLILPLFVSFMYHESSLPFMIPFIISFSVGFFLHKRYKENKSLDMSQGFVTIALSFAAISAIVAIPYLFVLEGNLADRIINSVFEAVSGITTTGLTILPSLSGVPKSILLFRSLTQWVGGIGIVIVFLFIISELRRSGSTVRESSDNTRSSLSLYHATISETTELDLSKLIRWVAKIYLIFTLIGITLLFISGMSLFEASSITFTSLSTGGFVVKDVFQPTGFQIAIIIALMLLGGISFFVHIHAFRLKIREVLRSIEPRLLFAFIATGVLLSMIFFRNFKVALFQVVSAFTGTGFSITDNNILPPLMLFVIFAGMIIGASMGSTCGGIKLFRIYTISASIKWIAKKLTSPKSAIVPFKIRWKPIDEDILIITYVFVFSYIAVLFFGIALFLVLGYGFLDSSFQVVSALGTVGLSTMSIVSVPIIGKIFLICAMLLGRLEILPILVIIRKIFSRS